MSNKLRRVTKVVKTPRNTGTAGLLHSIEAILKMPRVQQITIGKRGQIEYEYLLPEEEPDREVQISFDSLTPGAIVRNRPVVELPMTGNPAELSAPSIIAQVLVAARRNRLFPLAFVGGIASTFFEWHRLAGVDFTSTEEAYNLPFYADAQIPNEALLIPTGLDRGTELVDTVESYKIDLPSFAELAARETEIS